MISQPTPVGERLRAECDAVASRPQHLLLTLLGDHWYPQYAQLPSTALVALLGEFGVTEPNARAALSRLGRRGLLVSRKEGRRTSYALTTEAMDVLDAGTERIFTFATSAVEWDGSWTLVAFSLPEDQRTTRASLRTRLSWLGFAAVFDAVWVAPGDREADAAGVLAELGVTSATVLIGRSSALVAGGDPSGAWDLQALRERYDDFLARFTPLRDRIPELEPAAALVARTAVIDVWREFPGVDPDLPRALLPAGWPQREARELFAALYDGLAEPATARVREIIAGFSPDRASSATFHTTADALTLVGSHQS
ncbi:PaaX family transcriptional regulator [Amycolatopsis sp. CA-161197]|uniref:PaaX family transcriptional regulator n=1 Tax=Amycolatopsis sp. CA-161197 TaxID=3239922 RepID=UPI003D8C8245